MWCRTPARLSVSHRWARTWCGPTGRRTPARARSSSGAARRSGILGYDIVIDNLGEWVVGDANIVVDNAAEDVVDNLGDIVEDGGDVVITNDYWH